MSLRQVFHKIPACLAILAFLFLRLGSVDSAVVCFGADGHISLEENHASSSKASSAPALEAQPTLGIAAESYLSQQRHGLPCSDVSVAHFGEQYVVSNVGPVPQTPNSVALAPAYVGVKRSGTTMVALFARAPPAGSNSLRELGTVILLI